MRPRRCSRSRRLSPQVVQRSGSAHEGGGHVRLLPARLRHPLRLVSWRTTRALNSATTSLLHRLVSCVRVYLVMVFSSQFTRAGEARGERAGLQRLSGARAAAQGELTHTHTDTRFLSTAVSIKPVWNERWCVWCVSVSPVRVSQYRRQTGHIQEEPPHQQRAALGRQLGPKRPASDCCSLMDTS